MLNVPNTPIVLNAQSPCGPAVTLHRQNLWCLWVGQDHSIASRVFLGDDQGWVQEGLSPGESTALPPALASFEGELHAVFVANDGSQKLIHIRWSGDPDDGTTWSRGPDVGGAAEAGPSLAVHNGKLFLAYNAANTLLYGYYDPDTNKWATGFATGELTWGKPALVEIRGELHLLFTEADTARQIVDLLYDDSSTDPNNAWRRNQRPPEYAAGGVAAAGFGDYGYLVFQENNNNDLPILVSSYLTQWNWSTNIGQSSNDVPAVAAFRDKLSIVFVSKDSNRSVLWCEADLADPGDPEWMSAVPGIVDRPLGELCFPATHDSGAYRLYDDFVPENVLYGIPPALVTLHTVASSTPVGGIVDDFIDSEVEDTSLAQELSLAEQLHWGVRSIDLRVCAMNDGYYTFHAFRGESLQTLLSDIAWFLNSTSGEVVWIWLSPRGMTTDQADEVRSIVTTQLGPYCLPLTEDEETSAKLAGYTVGQVLAAGQAAGKSRVIVVDDSLSEAGDAGSLIWANPDEIRYSKYSNSSAIDTVLSGEEPGQGWALQDWYYNYQTVPMFELCMTLTPQDDDIIGDLTRRLRDEGIPDSVLQPIYGLAGLPWPPPQTTFTGLHQLSEAATEALPGFDGEYPDYQLNFISLDFVNETGVMDIVKRRCAYPALKDLERSRPRGDRSG
jgi:hypothetical protein